MWPRVAGDVTVHRQALFDEAARERLARTSLGDRTIAGAGEPRPRTTLARHGIDRVAATVGFAAGRAGRAARLLQSTLR